MSGFDVDSVVSTAEALALFQNRPFDLVLVEVDGDAAVREAESLCSEIKTAKSEQLVAFVCNWRVALLTDCPDEILRTEFDPAAFVEGVRSIVVSH